MHHASIEMGPEDLMCENCMGYLGVSLTVQEQEESWAVGAGREVNHMCRCWLWF